MNTNPKDQLVDLKRLSNQQLESMLHWAISLTGCQDVYFYKWQCDKNGYELQEQLVTTSASPVSKIHGDKTITEFIGVFKTPTIANADQRKTLATILFKSSKSGTHPESLLVHSIHQGNTNRGFIAFAHSQSSFFKEEYE